jgi:glycosyltransferase involved in cell wall biosynthesis
MSLNNLRVCVDTYNIDLPQGTGIKTYGLTLLAALKLAGASRSLMYARRIYRKVDDVISEADFHSPNWTVPRYERARAAARLAATALGKPLRAHKVPHNDFVIPPPLFPKVEDIYTCFDCYGVAQRSAMINGRGAMIDTGARLDVFHLTYPLPVRVQGARTVVTFHDAVPFRMPHATLDNKVSNYKSFGRVLKDADGIFVISETSRRDLHQVFDVNPDRVHLTYQASVAKPLDEDERPQLHTRLKALNLQEGKYFLFVSAIEPKKNLRTLLTAVLSMDMDIPVVVIGKKAWLSEQELQILDSVRPHVARQRVRLLGHVPNDTLRFLYAGALCQVVPSLYEGFGLPVLEAMQMGVPVISSNTSSLPEVGGDAALYFEPLSVSQLRAALERVIADAGLRTEMVRKGLTQAEKFSLSAYAERLETAYQAVVGGL